MEVMKVEDYRESDHGSPAEHFLSMDEVEEVALVWQQGKMRKQIRDMATDNKKEDMDVLSYYRFVRTNLLIGELHLKLPFYFTSFGLTYKN